jgi:hypothetical protein
MTLATIEDVRLGETIHDQRMFRFAITAWLWAWWYVTTHPLALATLWKRKANED